MRFVFGGLPIALGLLMVCGCALTQRNVADTDRYGFRSKRSSVAESDVKSSANDRLSFKSPQRKSRSKNGDAEADRSTADELAADEKPQLKKNKAGSTEVDVAEAKDGLGGQKSAAKKGDEISPTADSSRSSIKTVSADWGDDDSEVPVQQNPVQLQDAEFEAVDSAAISTAPQAPQGGEAKAEVVDSDRPGTKADSQLPIWSDRPAEATANHPANVKPTTPAHTARVTQANAAEPTQNQALQHFPGVTNPPPWQGDLNQLIAQIEQRLAQSQSKNKTDGGLDILRSQAQLRLLYLAAQRQEDALTSIPGLTSSQQEYWQQMMWAIFNSLDMAQFPESSERAAHTLAPLSAALRHTREDAPLTIKNMGFCKKISGFGNYERFPRNEFPPGYEVLLYTEIENFVSSPTGDGDYRTSLRSTIEIANSSGKVVWVKKFAAPTEDFCRNPRRDYFQNCHFHIPEDLPTGEYSLSLTIADEISRKQSTSTLKFVLK